MELDGNLSNSMELDGIRWNWMEIYLIPWNQMELDGPLEGELSDGFNLRYDLYDTIHVISRVRLDPMDLYGRNCYTIFI